VGVSWAIGVSWASGAAPNVTTGRSPRSRTVAGFSGLTLGDVLLGSSGESHSSTLLFRASRRSSMGFGAMIGKSAEQIVGV
jgi:hypothetical protein